MPPVIAEMLCNSPPLARATSSAIWITRGLEEAPGMALEMLAMISDTLAEETCDVVFRARYIGSSERGIMVSDTCSSLSNSWALLC